MFIIRNQPRFFTFHDHDGDSSYPCDTNGFLMTPDEWENISDKVNRPYSLFTPEEIDEDNLEQESKNHAEWIKINESTPLPDPEPRPGFVYVLHGVGTQWHKIGVTKDIKKRIKAFDTQGPFLCTLLYSHYSDDPYAHEKLLHDMYAEYRAEGEWFSLPVWALEEIAEEFVCHEY